MPRKLFIVDPSNEKVYQSLLERSRMRQTLKLSTTAATPRARRGGTVQSVGLRLTSVNEFASMVSLSSVLPRQRNDQATFGGRLEQLV